MTDADIIGDSVNIASRIESLGTAGAVLVSQKVVEEIAYNRIVKIMSSKKGS